MSRLHRASPFGRGAVPAPLLGRAPRDPRPHSITIAIAVPMRLLIWLGLTATLQFGLPRGASAQTPLLTVSANPGQLTIGTATAGSAPDAVVEDQTTLSIASSPSGARITARLDAPLPGGITLTITLQAPAGASSAGPVDLDTIERDLITNLPAGSFSGLRITYRLSATAGAGVISPSARNITLTIRTAP